MSIFYHKSKISNHKSQISVIHPAAIIDAKARLGEGVEIGPYAVVEGNAVIGDGCLVGAHAVIKSGVELGDGVTVDCHAVLGGLPQDLGFKAAIPSGVKIGKNAVLREGVTVSRATKPEGFTIICEGAYLMAYSHVAHDCEVGEHAIFANNVMLAGHVHIGAHCFLGGGAAVHQFVRMGESVMLSGISGVGLDVAPYLMCAERNSIIGFNLVGLKRRGFSRETISDLKNCYREIFYKKGKMPEIAAAALRDGLAKTPEGKKFLEFFTTPSKRGFLRPRRGKTEEGGEED